MALAMKGPAALRGGPKAPFDHITNDTFVDHVGAAPTGGTSRPILGVESAALPAEDVTRNKKSAVGTRNVLAPSGTYGPSNEANYISNGPDHSKEHGGVGHKGERYHADKLVARDGNTAIVNGPLVPEPICETSHVPGVDILKKTEKSH